MMRVLLNSGGVGLFERKRELAVADHEVERLAAGAGAVVVVEGPAGIGKSALLAAIHEIARARVWGVAGTRL